MAIKAGRVGTEFSGSMAAAIEKALIKEWKEVKGWEMPEPGQEERRILCVAIAQGIIRYLTDNAQSLSLENLEVVQIENNLIESSGSGPSPAGVVTVTQEPGDTNKVKSKGSGGAIKIETEGALL
jgi:hypothetical protein